MTKKNNIFPIWNNKYFYLLLIVLIIVFLQNIFLFTNHLNSDMVAPMEYARKVVETKNIFTPEWSASQELFSFKPWVFSVPVYAITKNLLLSQQVSIILTTILVILSFGYLLKKIGISINYIMYAQTMLLGLFSGDVVFMFLNDYSLFVITTFFTLGVYCDAKTNLIKNLIIGFVAFLAVFSGMAGIRMALMLYLPLFFLDIVLLIQKTWENKAFNFKSISLSLLLLVGNGIGYLIYKLILIPYTKAKDITSFSFANSSDILSDINFELNNILHQFGIALRGQIFTIPGVLTLFKIFMLGFVLLLIFYIKKLDGFYKLKMVLSFFSLSVFLTFFYEVITSAHGSARYYLFFCYFAIIALIIFVQQLSKDNRPKKYIGMAVSLCLLVGIAINTGNTLYSNIKSNPNKTRQQIAEYLLDNEYHTIISTYWDSNVYTGLSNGKIKAVCISHDFQPYDWLTDRKNLENITGEVVLIASEQDLDMFKNTNETIFSDVIEKTVLLESFDQYSLYYFEQNPFKFNSVL